MKLDKILLASHSTDGARAAEEAVLKMAPKEVHHLVVVPDFWKGMRGDDWLNNAITQERFGNYVEDQLQREILVEQERLFSSFKSLKTTYTSQIKLGKPAPCLLSVMASDQFDLVVIGSPRPKGAPGYRSRMALDELTRGLSIPLLTIPHPAT